MEQIAADSSRDRDQATVVEVLSAFVRVHSDPLYQYKASLPETAAELSEPIEEQRRKAAKYVAELSHPPVDVQGAVLVARLAATPGGSESGRSRPGNLAKARLVGAKLTGADLSGADLTGADLSDADLTGANLTGANLTEANLYEANLTRAFLVGATNLTGANLHEANLTRAFLHGADLTEVLGGSLTQQQLDGAFGSSNARLPPCGVPEVGLSV